MTVCLSVCFVCLSGDSVSVSAVCVLSACIAYRFYLCLSLIYICVFPCVCVCMCADMCVRADKEKTLVDQVYANAIDSLSDDDKLLPQVHTHNIVFY